MHSSGNNYQAMLNTDARRIAVIWKSALVGILAGTATVLYRMLLTKAEAACFAVYAYAGAHPWVIPGMFVLLAGLGLIVGTLSGRYKAIGGSGIPQVKGTILGYFKNGWRSTLIAKIVGGTLGILAGLSLGREGPSIQLGACVAQGVGERLGDTRTERKILMAAGASAGLAAAFNAPLAGVMFAMEEVFKYISPLILLSTMVSSILADLVARAVFGAAPVFTFSATTSLPVAQYWMVCALGVLVGAGGALYNTILIGTQKLYKRFFKQNVRARMLVPFLMAGVLGLTFPYALGGGHAALEHISLSTGLWFLVLLLSIKFLFSMISFGSGAPGGIFFPLLIIGAMIGAIFGHLAAAYWGLNPALYDTLVILAMAGYFAAIVRAPLTGVVLLLEMTGSFVNLLPLALIAIIASTVADLLKSLPIYDALLENQLHDLGLDDEPDEGKKITVEVVVHHGSDADGKHIRELCLPEHCLLIAIRREGKDILPHGNTLVRAGDYLVFLVNLCEEARDREMLGALTAAA